MAVATWTEEMDRVLLAARGARGLAWKYVDGVVPGATVRDCQKRYQFLTSGRDRPTINVAAEPRRGPDPDENGLERLIRKSKLTPTRRAWAERYRDVSRLADAGGGSVKSCLDVQVAGGRHDGGVFEAALDDVLAAKRELFRMRNVVLRGQTDMLTVMDGVCVRGLTLTALAEGNDRRAIALEAVLMVALDLLSAGVVGEMKKVA